MPENEFIQLVKELLDKPGVAIGVALALAGLLRGVLKPRGGAARRTAGTGGTRPPRAERQDSTITDLEERVRRNFETFMRQREGSGHEAPKPPPRATAAAEPPRRQRGEPKRGDVHRGEPTRAPVRVSYDAGVRAEPKRTERAAHGPARHGRGPSTGDIFGSTAIARAVPSRTRRVSAEVRKGLLWSEILAPPLALRDPRV